MQNDDEDTECYFLQPVSSPYDLSQKVKDANKALNHESIDHRTKESRIKFKDNLVDYEPEFSYEEASSIESDDNIDDYILEDDHIALEKQLESTLILQSFESKEKSNEINISNEEEEEINDEISEELDTNILNDANDSFDLSLEPKTTSPDKLIDSLMILDRSKNNSPHKLNVKQAKPVASTKSNYLEIGNISCNQHCIEKIEYSNIFLRKIINLKDGMIKLPRLKLHRRKCCERNKTKIQQKLPCYTGLRSEYGLTTFQLQRRDNIKETVMMKEKEKQRRNEENKLNKSIENESIFCNWLKSVSSRKKINKNYLQSLFKPLTFNITKCSIKSHLNKKRPIRVPQIRIKRKISNISRTPPIIMCDISVEIPRKK